MYVSSQGGSVVITALSAITQLSNSFQAEIQSTWSQPSSILFFSYTDIQYV